MRMGMPAHLCQERSPCAVRAPPARMRAGRPRTRCNPQVRAFAGGGFWGAPACLRGARASGAHAGGTPAHPVQPSGACFCRGVGSPGVPARCARLWRARGRDACTPGATLRCVLLQGGGEPWCACAVRAPLARTWAGRLHSRRNPQVRAFAGGGFWGSPGVHLPFQGLPLRPLWEKGQGG
jgi:hypothetical protein